jgi:alpha-beta hydrolase superfamily lysophospholipase
VNERKLSDLGTDELWTGNFRSSHGPEMIYYKSLRPIDPPQLQLLFLHDFYDYHDRYWEMGQRLKSLLPFQIDVTWMDFKGHGMSAGTRGHVDHFEDLTKDAHLLLNAIKKRDHHSPIAVIGQGLGGLVALKLIDQAPMDNSVINFSVLLNPLINFGNPFIDMNESRLSKIFPTLRKLGLPMKIDFQRICNDEEKIHHLKSDPLMRSRISLGLLSELMKASHQIKKSSYYINSPTLFLAGEDDIFTNKDQLTAFIKGIPEHHATYRNYEGAKHDLANDKNREMMFNDISKWIFLQMEGRL